MDATKSHNPTIFAFVVGATLFAGSLPALAEPAGRVLFIAGNVLVTDPAGNLRALERGASVEEGDIIATHEGRVQIQFKDGAFLALQPQTRFKVERYRYTAAGDDQDSVWMSLVKGGLRTISGLVGKKNRDAYRLETEVATIGIRGTDYALELDTALSGHVNEGAIEVCSGAGCAVVESGFAFSVRSTKDLPALTERRAFLPPTQPELARLRTAGELELLRRGVDASQPGSANSSTPPDGADRPPTNIAGPGPSDGSGPLGEGLPGAQPQPAPGAGGGSVDTPPQSSTPGNGATKPGSPPQPLPGRAAAATDTLPQPGVPGAGKSVAGSSVPVSAPGIVNGGGTPSAAPQTQTAAGHAGAASSTLAQPGLPGNRTSAAGSPLGIANAGTRPANAASPPGHAVVPFSNANLKSSSADPIAGVKTPPGIANKLTDPLSDVAGPRGLTKKHF